MGLKEATAELHSKAEKTQFSQLIFSGTIPEQEYAYYLFNMYHIHNALESKYELPHPSLNRCKSIEKDLGVLIKLKMDLTESTKKYIDYINTLTEEQWKAHIYVNYLAIVYGGQMIKSKVPGLGAYYNINNMQECVGAIRAFLNDDMSNEANKGFQFNIDVLENIWNTLRPNGVWELGNYETVAQTATAININPMGGNKAPINLGRL
jgi:heme oxygenase